MEKIIKFMLNFIITFFMSKNYFPQMVNIFLVATFKTVSSSLKESPAPPAKDEASLFGELVVTKIRKEEIL